MNILIIGGTGGIGLAIIQQLLIIKPHANIHATFFRHQPQYQHSHLHWHYLDISLENQIAAPAKQLPQLDVVRWGAILTNNRPPPNYFYPCLRTGISPHDGYQDVSNTHNGLGRA